MDRERTDTGEFIQTVTEARVLGVFDVVEGPVVTSGDVADQLGCTPEAARRKLNELHRAGTLGRRRTAGRLVYWLAEAGGPPGGSPDNDSRRPIPGRGQFEPEA